MKIAFLFSGQGAQYPGMMQELFETEPAAARLFSEADEALGRAVSELCFNGTQEELNLTHNTQPCVLAADLAAGLILREHGIEPQGVAGFSLGEYAALTFAGAIPTRDVFPMVQLRADSMQEAVPQGKGEMAALIGVPAGRIEQLCADAGDKYVIPANYNSPVQTVISGTKEGVEHVIAAAESEGITCMRLAVSAPFHCALMEPVAEKLAKLFETKAFADPSVPVYMNVNGERLTDGAAIPALLAKQAMSPVQWVKTLENMRADGFDTFIECGPGRTLSGLVKKTLPGVAIHRVENRKTLDNTLSALEAQL